MMAKLLRATALSVGLVGILAVIAPAAALASGAATLSDSACVSHSLTIIPIGDRTMFDSYVDNECGTEETFTITYKVTGPCAHTSTVALPLAEGAWDVVTTFHGPCAGHYTVRQRVTANGERIGEVTVEFDVPG
jgi:hypothetical protein